MGTSSVIRGRDILHLIKEQILRLAIGGSIDEALSLVFQRSERSHKRENQPTFHGIRHTQGDISRTETILTAIQRTNQRNVLTSLFEMLQPL